MNGTPGRAERLIPTTLLVPRISGCRRVPVPVVCRVQLLVRKVAAAALRLCPPCHAQGSLCVRFDPVHALEMPSGDGIHTGVVLRHGIAPLVVQSHPSARQPLLLDSERSSTLILEEFKSWYDMGSHLASEWPRTALARFPTVGSSNALWNKIAQVKSRRLLTLVCRFPHKSQLLQVLSDDTLAAWSAVWRQEFMYDPLVAYRDRTSYTATTSWLDDWKRRT